MAGSHQDQVRVPAQVKFDPKQSHTTTVATAGLCTQVSGNYVETITHAIPKSTNGFVWACFPSTIACTAELQTQAIKGKVCQKKSKFVDLPRS